MSGLSLDFGAIRYSGNHKKSFFRIWLYLLYLILVTVPTEMTNRRFRIVKKSRIELKYYFWKRGRIFFISFRSNATTPDRTPPRRIRAKKNFKNLPAPPCPGGALRRVTLASIEETIGYRRAICSGDEGIRNSSVAVLFHFGKF